MSKKYLITIICFVLISFVSLSVALRELELKSVKEVLGTNTFFNTKNNLFKLGKIQFVDTDNQEFNLYYDGVWYFAEAADYFVEEKELKKFFNIINDSVLVENVEIPEGEGKFYNIKTYDTEDNLLDDIYISAEDKSVIKYGDKSNFYKINNMEELSFNPSDWLPYPLMSIDEDLIIALNVGGKYMEKEKFEEVKEFSKKMKRFLNVLEDVDYNGIISDDFFDEEYADAKMKEIKIYMFGGLNYRLQVYFRNNEYYLRIIPERELIARTEVNRIIRTKNMYYKGWTFILNNKQGALLYNFALEEFMSE